MVISDRITIIYRKIFPWLLAAIAFSIPVYEKAVPVFIILFTMNWVIGRSYFRTIRLVFVEKSRFLLFSFSILYLLYLAGLIHTSNFQYAWEDLEIKLSILLFPLILSTFDFPVCNRQEMGYVLKVFAAGCIASSLVMLGHAFYASVFLKQSGAFYYTNLAWGFHPSYFAMYLTFAFSNILYFLLIRRSVKGVPQLTGHILILLLFTLMIILLSSKAGLLIWATVIVFYTFLLMFRYRRIIAGILFMAVSLTVFTSFLLLFPLAGDRVLQAKEDMASKDSVQNSNRSTGERVVIWNASKKIIKENFLFGVGTGDVKDKLQEEYRNANAPLVLEKKYNAHNQYLQTQIALGIFGLLMLLAMMIVPAFIALKQKYYIYFAFILITGISMLFESMLERQQGVVFYIFFNTLLFATVSNREPAEIES